MYHVDSSYISQKMASWRPNFPTPRLWQLGFVFSQSFLKIFNHQAIVIHSVLRSHVNVFVNDLAGHHVEEDQG